MSAPDLWCTYAATRTLAWLGRADEVVDREGTQHYLIGRANADGGYAWSRGMPSDAWATFYCTQSLTDMRLPVPRVERTERWLESTWSGDAYAMTPGQEPDVWATHFSSRSATSVCRNGVPDRGRLLRWLGALQTREGGLTWSPEHSTADVRACHYGVAAWHAVGPAEPPWDVPALLRWIRNRQDADGGIRFSPDADVPCMWAVYRATAALALLGAQPDRPVEPWVMARRGPRGAFVRWDGYGVEDVWASFCAVGALRATGCATASISDSVVARLNELACDGGGYTYREPEAAADALSTASAVMLGRAGAEAVSWLESCQMPNEGGVMYMPGRGSEVRCTLWAVAAGAFKDSPAGAARILDWLRCLQNPEGGFGYWEGRGSDPVSTSAAVEIISLLGADLTDVLDPRALADWTKRCVADTLRTGLQVARIRQQLGKPDTAGVRAILDRHCVRGGGWANEGSRIPDLLSTYEAVATIDRHALAVDTDHLGRFVERVHTDRGTAWSPLAPATGDPLADCLGSLLRARVRGRPLVAALTLS